MKEAIAGVALATMMSFSLAAMAGEQGLPAGALGDLENTQDIEVGYLEVIWSDPLDSRGVSSVSVFLVNKEQRIELDPDQAHVAAQDLYALAGRPVAIYRNSHDGSLEALVGIDDIGLKRQSDDQGLIAQRVDKWKTIACKFPEWPLFPVSVSHLDSQYGFMRGHIGHYWDAMSYGKVRVQGTANGWFDLPHTQAYYMPGGELDTTALAQDCVAAASAHVDLSQEYGINMAFNKQLDNRAHGGRVCAPLAGRPQPCTPITWLNNSAVRNMRVILHEMGHAYTLPHSDNSDNDDDTYDNAWDVMSRANWGPSHPIYGTRPIYLMGWHRKRLGWMPEDRIATFVGPQRFNTLVYLDSTAEDDGSGKHLAILREAPRRDREGNISDPSSGVHYLLEARLGDIDLDRGLPGQAVIISRVSHGSFSRFTVLDADNPPANVNTNEGSMFKAGEAWRAPNGLGKVRVIGRTRHGFVISIGPDR